MSNSYLMQISSTAAVVSVASRTVGIFVAADNLATLPVILLIYQQCQVVKLLSVTITIYAYAVDISSKAALLILWSDWLLLALY